MMRKMVAADHIKKLQLNDAERKHLRDNRGLMTDTDGNEIMRGLTAAESSELWTLRRDRAYDSKSRHRRMELNARHEAARMSAVMAESDAKDAGPETLTPPQTASPL
jgi:hypothetical protein